MSLFGGHQYYVYQGKIKGQPVGRGRIIVARGPKSAMKQLYSTTPFREVPQREIFGNPGIQTARNIGRQPAHKQPASWIQLNRVDSDESHFYIIGR